MLRITDRGLYCEAGDFFIDPWLPVDRAVVTHAHGDHARWGCRAYVGSREGQRVMHTRLGADASIQSLAFGESLTIGGVRISGLADVTAEMGDGVYAVALDEVVEVGR